MKRIFSRLLLVCTAFFIICMVNVTCSVAEYVHTIHHLKQDKESRIDLSKYGENRECYLYIYDSLLYNFIGQDMCIVLSPDNILSVWYGGRLKSSRLGRRMLVDYVLYTYERIDAKEFFEIMESTLRSEGFFLVYRENIGS